MPFIDRSTLTYPATNSFPIRKWLDPARDPASTDYRNFQIFDIWINDANDSAWIMVDKTATSGTWLQMATSGTGILTITGDAGGPVGPDGASNINLFSGAGLTITGNPGTNTLTVTLDASVPLQFNEMVGSATAAANIINVVGTGGITTSGAGNTITVTAGATIPTTFTEDAGSATPAANNLNILGTANQISTAGAGSTVTISLNGKVANQYTADVGVAVPAANNLNIFGAGSTSTSAAGSTVTITSTGGGIAWSEITVVGPTQMVVDHGYITNNALPVQLLLPLNAVIGSTIVIVGKGAGGWLITQNAGQTILLGASASTVGVGGTVGSSESSACIEMVCITANTTWRIRDANGNIIIT